MIQIIILIEGQSIPITLKGDDIIYLNYEFVADLLMSLRIKKRNIEFISYLNSKNSYEIINIKSPTIIISNVDKLEIMVKLNIAKEKYPEINKLNTKVKNLISSLKKDFEEFDKFLKGKKEQNESKNELNKNIISIKYSNSSNSNSLSDAFSLELLNEINNSYLMIENKNKNIDIIILTANPLYYEENKELRTMNDFVRITDSIYQVVSRTHLKIYSQFLTLTKKNFIYALMKKPKILHLICKSTYKKVKIKNEKEKIKEEYIPALLFEKENLISEIMSKEKLSPILSYFSKNLKDICLFISTPLSQDVYNIFTTVEPNIKFKNIFVQHTTIADLSYMALFNKKFYQNLLEKRSINISIENAKCIKPDNYQFCCCSHSHNNNNCDFKKNFYNEILREDEEDNLCDNKFQDSKIISPHFNHLSYKCKCHNSNNNNFLYVHIFCPNKILIHKKRNNYFCCCEEIKSGHNFDNILILNDKENNQENIIFQDYIEDELDFSTILNSENIPNYGKMKFLVGLNQVFYNSFNFIMEENDKKILNFYRRQYNSFEIDTIIYNLKEYIKERNSYFKIQNNEEMDEINESENYDYNLDLKRNESDILSEKKAEKSSLSISSTSIKLSKIKSANQLKINATSSIWFIIISKEEDFNFDDNFIFDKTKILIINAFIVENWEEILQKKKLKKMPELIIIFSVNKIKKDLFFCKKEDIANIPFNKLNDYDYKVENQIHKISNYENDFNKAIEEKIIYLEEKEIEEIQNYIKNQEDKNIFYEILFLFHCICGCLYNIELYEIIIETEQNKKIIKYFMKRKIIKEMIEIKKNEKKIKYTKNREIFGKIYDSNLIEDNVKQNILNKLFLFFAKKFRYIISQEKLNKDSKFNEKGYKPNEYLFSFSAIQSLGIWLPLNNPTKFNDKKKNNYSGDFDNLDKNFQNIFFEKNIELCMKNKDIWENVKECLEDISITYLTLHSMFNTKNINSLIVQMQGIFYKSQNLIFSSASKLRLTLFNQMQYNTNKSVLEELYDQFSDIKNQEGKLETLFGECMLSKNNWEKIKNIYDTRMTSIINGLRKNKDNDKFCDLFESKIKYKIIKYKIKKYIPIDLKQLKDLVKIFLKYNFLYQAMKTILLICLYYFYYQKLQIEDIDNSKKNFLLYFNFAYFLKMKEYDKCKYYIENKSKYYSLEKNLDGEKQNFDKFKEDLKTIFEEYKVAWNINDNDKETKFWNNSSN